MLWLRWIVGLSLLAASGWLISMNWAVFWMIHVQKRHAPSWIPLLGGILGAAALAILPLGTVQAWWWLPFLLDWGSVSGFLETLIFHLGRMRCRSD